MRNIVMTGFALTMFLAACGQQTSTPSLVSSDEVSYWSKNEVNAVKDLSELGKVSTQGSIFLFGGKAIRAEDISDQVYTTRTETSISSQAINLNGSYSETAINYAPCITTLGAQGSVNFKSVTQVNGGQAIYAAADAKLYGSDAVRRITRLYDATGVIATTKGAPTVGIVAKEQADVRCSDLAWIPSSWKTKGWHKIIYKDASGKEVPVISTSEG